MKLTKSELSRLIHLLPDIEFRRGNAVGLAHLRNPRNAAEIDELIFLLRKLGIDARINPKTDVQILKLPDGVWREVNEHAAKYRMSRHEALNMLVKSGLAATEMAERVGVYRQMAQEDLEGEIAGALAPIKERERSNFEMAGELTSSACSQYRRRMFMCA